MTSCDVMNKRCKRYHVLFFKVFLGGENMYIRSEMFTNASANHLLAVG